MDEWDVVRSIFLEKLNCKETVQKALTFESQRQWRDAQCYYKQLIECDENLEKKDFYYESYFKCFAHLGEWEHLSKAIDTQVGSWDNLWDNDFNQQKLLPWYISAQVKTALFTNKSSDVFLTSINNTLKSPNSEYLQSRFCEELAILRIFQNDTDSAEQHLNAYIDNFLESWPLLDPLHCTLRYGKLLQLRSIVDMCKFLNVIQTLTVDVETFENDIKTLIGYWEKTCHENLPSIILVETKNLYRRQFINLLQNKIQGFQDYLTNPLEELDKIRVKLNSDVIECAIQESNFYMAKKYINLPNSLEDVCRKLSMSKLAVVKSQMSHTIEDKLTLLIKSTVILNSDELDKNNPFMTLSFCLQTFENLEQITNILNTNPNLLINNKTAIGKIVPNITSPDSIVIHGAEKLKSAIGICEQYFKDAMAIDNVKSIKEHKLIAKAYILLAYFSKDKSFQDFLLSVLRAMKFNSTEARQLFPCILMQHDWTDVNKHSFVAEVDFLSIGIYIVLLVFFL